MRTPSARVHLGGGRIGGEEMPSATNSAPRRPDPATLDAPQSSELWEGPGDAIEVRAPERKRAMTEMRKRTEGWLRELPSPPPMEVADVPHAAQTTGTSSGVEPIVVTHASTDLRVRMVLEVLGGRSVDDVAHEWQVEPQLLHRWLRDFLVAGASQITNRPEPDEAARRDRFMAAWAHELRTPVSVARGWLALLEDGDVPPEELDVAVARMSEAMSRLSEQILDVELSSSASLGRLRVTPETVAVETLCVGLPGFERVRQGGAGATVDGDPRLLTRVLRDLWAIAHREPEPTGVALDVVVDGPWTDLRVVREGEPISAMVMKALFDPFGANHDATGVTTGLFLTRALVVAHGGYLGAEGDEASTVLYARLPRTSDDAGPEGPDVNHEGEHR